MMIPKPEKEKRKRHKQTIACDISPEVRTKVFERDNGNCVLCPKRGTPNAHYIPRSQGGLGIEENIVCLCLDCHHAYDNGNQGERDRLAARIENYLRSKYPNWDRSKLIYDKWKEVDPAWRF